MGGRRATTHLAVEGVFDRGQLLSRDLARGKAVRSAMSADEFDEVGREAMDERGQSGYSLEGASPVGPPSVTLWATTVGPKPSTRRDREWMHLEQRSR